MPRLGNTDFKEGAAIGCSFDDFCKVYAGKLDFFDIKDAFRILGGKMTTKAETEETPPVKGKKQKANR